MWITTPHPALTDYDLTISIVEFKRTIAEYPDDNLKSLIKYFCQHENATTLIKYCITRDVAYAATMPYKLNTLPPDQYGTLIHTYKANHDLVFVYTMDKKLIP